MRPTVSNTFVQLLLIAVTVIAATCEPAPEGVVTAANAGDEDDVLAPVRQDWVAAYNAGDAATLAGFFANDAVMLPPNGPALSGKAAIETYLSRLLEESSTVLEIVSSDVRARGDLAVERATYTARDSASPDSPTRTGKYVMAFERAPDGTWKIVWDIWNSNEPTPEETP